MSRAVETALLPAGLQDVLPPDAAHEAATVERLMGTKAEARFAFISDKAEFASEELLDV